MRNKKILRTTLRKELLLVFIFTTCIRFSFAQFFGQVAEQKRYEASKVIDSTYGIMMYEKLNFQTGGDSVRNDKKGYAYQGWISDLYMNGNVLHKGFYEEGHLKMYKNYYPNGTLERSFKIVDFKRCNMQIFYPDSTKKSEITYYDGSPQFWTDYYKNGKIEYIEESSKSLEYLIQRKSFAEDGRPQEIFELTDPKKKIYTKKEYYENGKIKAEGTMKYSKSAVDYQKDGDWKVYDENGKVTEEKWVNGEQVTK